MRKTNTGNVVPILPKSLPKILNLTPDQEELVKIRNALGMSQHTFAESIEISKPRLVSYEQGRTSGVPDDIMKEARALLKNGGRVKGDRYSKMGMPEIIAEWARDLKVGYDDDVQISNFIGASPEALSRWKNLEARPELLMLKQYRQIVGDLKIRLEKSSGAAKNSLAIVK
ncbi:MAG: helix-turn-helix transcriptional regulator [Sideroxydans sp.]|nr:helix-turn-helix transcriptional regulator [Sideroxydans sp.]MDD5056658.1 helix-turn-helix transcriptional regulator [Sideroxydans sp.]